MNLFKKLNILFFLINSLLVSAAEIDFTSPYEAGNYFFQLENYSSALKEYKRALFFEEKPGELLYERIGDCYSKTGLHDKALENYRFAIMFAQDDSLKATLYLKRAAAYIFSSEYYFALQELYQMPKPKSEALESRRNLYLGITYYGLENLNKAEEHFIAVSNDPVVKQQIAELLKNKKKLSKPNSSTAMFLSLLIPGLGHMYAGDAATGINSFILSESLLILAVFVGFNYSIMDAVISVIPWYQRYYFGGVKDAKNIAAHRREEKKYALYQEIIEALSHPE